MAEWKKVIVSGSGVAQLSNDANYLINSQSNSMLSGSFSGSFQGDGSGLTGVTADGTISGSVQVTVQDTTGFSALQSNISASFAGSASAHTQREALIATLSASVDTHLDANITALSSSVDTHLDANISALSSSAEVKREAISASFATTQGGQDSRLTSLESFTGSLDDTFATEAELNTATASLSASAHSDRIAKIAVLSASVDTHLDANITALSQSTDSHLDSQLSVLSASVDTHLDANITAISQSSHSQRVALYEINSASIAALDGDFATDAELAAATSSLSSSAHTDRVAKVASLSGSAHTARRSEISDLSGSAHTQRGALITGLSSSVDTHLDANISALSGAAHTARRSEISDLSGSVDTHLDANITALSASVDTHLDANITALSTSVDAHLDSEIALLSASAEAARAGQSSDLTDLIASQSAFDTAMTLSGTNVTIAGDLEVSGTTTTVNSTTVEFSDNIISLNGTGAANGGIEVNDANGPASGSLIWDGTLNYWKAGGQGSEAKVLLGTGDDVISGSSQVTVQSTTGFAALQANVTASFAPIALSGSAHTARRSEISDLSGSAHTARRSEISDLSSSVDTHLDANITALSASVDTHLDANITAISTSAHTARRSEISDLSGSAHTDRIAKVGVLSGSAHLDRIAKVNVLSGSAATAITNLSGSAHADRIAKIAVLSASVDTHLDASITALSQSAHAQRKSEDTVLSASAHTARANLASTLAISGSSGNDLVNLKTDSLSFAGEGGVAVNVTDNTVTIDTTDILSGSDQIVTGLLNQDVNFGTGAITASGYSGDGSGLTNLTVTQNATVDDSFTSVTSHTVTHNFGSKNVIVQVYDTNDDMVIPQNIDTSNVNQAVIDFGVSFSGRAVVARGGHIVSGSIPFANLIAVPTLVSGSSQVTVQDTDGFTDLQSNISSSFAVSSSAHTQREALIATLSASADTHLDANIAALSASVDTHLDASIAALSASVDTHLDANIAALSASTDSHLDSEVALLSASAHTARGTIDSSFTIAGGSGSDTFTTGGTLTFAGTSAEIETTVTDDQVQIGIVTNPTLTGDVTITGDLTVTGDTIEQQVTNLNVEDKFILINSGSAAADAGIVVNGAGSSLGWDQSEGRWALDYSGATWNQTTITSDAFVAAVVTSDDANYQKVGNIRIDGSDIYIYV